MIYTIYWIWYDIFEEEVTLRDGGEGASAAAENIIKNI